MHLSKTTTAVLSFLLLTNKSWAVPSDKRASDKCLQSRFLSIDPDSLVRKRWPENTIKYSFKDDDAEDKLEKPIKEAFKIWTDAGLRDVIKMEKVDYKANSHALVISLNSDNKMNSQIGYMDSGEAEPNRMSIDPKARFTPGELKVALAHELGHVFGLLHEHQRDDAPNYVVFNCDNLADYDTFKDGKDKNGKKWDMKKLCTDRKAAADALFTAADLLPYDSDFIETCKKSDNFDFDSIMLYGSEFGGRQSKLGTGRKNVLVRKNKKDGSDKIEGNFKPSNGDIARLRAMYPVG